MLLFDYPGGLYRRMLCVARKRFCLTAEVPCASRSGQYEFDQYDSLFETAPPD